MFKKIDSNQTEVVKQLRQLGISVYITSMVGKGFPDLVVGANYRNYLFELKDGEKTASRKQLTDEEKKFFGSWKGQVHKVESLDEILEVINI